MVAEEFARVARIVDQILMAASTEPNRLVGSKFVIDRTIADLAATCAKWRSLKDAIHSAVVEIQGRQLGGDSR